MKLENKFFFLIYIISRFPKALRASRERTKTARELTLPCHLYITVMPPSIVRGARQFRRNNDHHHHYHQRQERQYYRRRRHSDQYLRRGQRNRPRGGKAGIAGAVGIDRLSTLHGGGFARAATPITNWASPLHRHGRPRNVTGVLRERDRILRPAGTRPNRVVHAHASRRHQDDTLEHERKGREEERVERDEEVVRQEGREERPAASGQGASSGFLVYIRPAPTSMLLRG